MGYAIRWLRVRAEFMEGKIQTFLDVNLLKGDRKQLWVNPDCGLKTREWSQVRQPCLDGRDALGHLHCWLALPFCTGCLHWMGCGNSAAALLCACQCFLHAWWHLAVTWPGADCQVLPSLENMVKAAANARAKK